MDNKLKLEFQFATLLTSKDADDVVALASIEKSSIGRILRNALLFEIERHRHEIENFKRLKSAA
jgi:hypothetical protein